MIIAIYHIIDRTGLFFDLPQTAYVGDDGSIYIVEEVKP